MKHEPGRSGTSRHASRIPEGTNARRVGKKMATTTPRQTIAADAMRRDRADAEVPTLEVSRSQAL